MEWNTLFQLIHSCTDCNTSLITGIEQLSAHFQEHIFFQSRQSVDCTLFFQQILEDKKPGELCCITDSYHIYTCVVHFQKKHSSFSAPIFWKNLRIHLSIKSALKTKYQFLCFLP